MLLSFAQFEREVIGERVRDKIAASKRKGLWVGGPVPQEGLAALQIVACHFAAAACRGDRGLGTVCRELQVGIIEASDYLMDLNAITNVDEALHDLAGHAEADSALNPRSHYPGIGQSMPADRLDCVASPEPVRRLRFRTE